jgi:hypothetical protein
MPNTQSYAAPRLNHSANVGAEANRSPKCPGLLSSMKRTTFPSLTLLAVLIAATGCATSSRMAWWKKDIAKPEDSSAVARNAKPTLPSTQSTPQAVAVAGLTPATPPSSTNLAAAGPQVAGATPALPGATPAAGAVPPSVSIPVTSAATLANAPTATYPPTQPGADLADKLVSTPNAKTAATVPATAAAPAGMPPQVASVPAAGPYDPNGYKPTAAVASNDPSAAAEVDRYGMSSSPSSPAAAAPGATAQLTSDPSDRYGYTPSAPQAVAASGGTPITDPNVAAGDRYGNPTIPAIAEKTAQAAPAVTASPAEASNASVKLASAPGQYRPGRTSSYTSTPAGGAVEVASRPAPAASAAPATTPAATGDGSQPWTPPATGARY